MIKSVLSRSFLPIFISSFLLFLAVACQKELTDPGGPTPPPPTPVVVVDDNITVIAGVKGIVINENNQPVSGATVTSGSNTTTTDRYGVFRFNNITLSKANGYVKVDKPGYFTGRRTFVSTANRIHNIRIKLLPKTNTGTFAGNTGGTINLTSGGKLVMPGNAVTDASGNAYTGSVNVAMTWIDPTASNLPEIMMGDLRGITTSGEERGLATYGMLGVELTGAGGQTLKIATGKTAELTFPIPAAILANAPATIDLWHFDETKGRWIQEGTAAKSGTNYVAQVSHFSFWNCDAPYPLINLCMTLVNSDNNPLVNAFVRIKRPNGSYGYGYTDSTGNLCGKVPKSEALILEVMDQCYNVVFTQTIGPFSADASLGTITVNIPAINSLTITGTIVNCSNANVTNGTATVYMTGSYSYTVPVNNGAFSVTIVKCNGGTVNFSVLGVDNTTLQQSVPVSGSGTSGTVNVGTIQACGTSSAQFIEMLIDGSPVNFTAPPDFFYHSDSTATTGPYSTNTWIAASRQNAGGSSYASFSFNNNMVAANGLPINNVAITAGTGFSSQQIITPAPTVNITTFGPAVTGYVEGNFSIQMNFSGVTKNVVCNFRVRRS